MGWLAAVKLLGHGQRRVLKKEGGRAGGEQRVAGTTHGRAHCISCPPTCSQLAGRSNVYPCAGLVKVKNSSA